MAYEEQIVRAPDQGVRPNSWEGGNPMPPLTHRTDSAYRSRGMTIPSLCGPRSPSVSSGLSSVASGGLS